MKARPFFRNPIKKIVSLVSRLAGIASMAVGQSQAAQVTRPDLPPPEPNRGYADNGNIVFRESCRTTSQRKRRNMARQRWAAGDRKAFA